MPSCLPGRCHPLSLSLPVLHTPTVATVLHTGALGGAVTASEVVEGQLESGKSGRAETALLPVIHRLLSRVCAYPCTTLGAPVFLFPACFLSLLLSSCLPCSVYSCFHSSFCSMGACVFEHSRMPQLYIVSISHVLQDKKLLSSTYVNIQRSHIFVSSKHIAYPFLYVCYLTSLVCLFLIVFHAGISHSLSVVCKFSHSYIHITQLCTVVIKHEKKKVSGNSDQHKSYFQ